MSPRPSEPRQTTALAFAALAWAIVIVYGNLVPLAYHDRSTAEAWSVFLQNLRAPLDLGSRGDYVLWYAPLGFLLTGTLARAGRSRGFFGGIVVFALCVALAIGVEFAQVFFPPRTVSLSDILAETLGAALGIVLWLVAGERLISLWNELLQGGPKSARALLFLYALAYLVLALFPFDFIFSGGELAQKLADRTRAALLLTQSCGGLRCGAHLIAEILGTAPLGVFLGMTVAPGRRVSLTHAFGWGVAIGVAIEGLQIFLSSGISQGASILTRGLGMVLGAAVYATFRREWLIQYRPQMKFLVLLGLPLYLLFLLGLSGFFGARIESLSSALAKVPEIHYEPFYYHYFSSNTQALYSLLVHAAAYAPIGIAVWIFAGDHGKTAVWLSGVAAALAATVTESLKLFLRGKHPDPSDVLIAAAAAMCACAVALRLTRAEGKPAPAETTADALRVGAQSTRASPSSSFVPRPAPKRFITIVVAAVVAAAALVGGGIAVQPSEQYIDETKLPQLPAPEALPPVDLPRFRHVHPRLPYPSGSDILEIAKRNPALIERVRTQAAGGKGAIETAVLQALIDPASVDLALVHRRLMSIVPSGRGHEQVKPLAVAYDWLYTRWTDAQRAQLEDKLADGCDYIVGVIRKDRMSPYNVILYNAPLQALMACSIALYGDGPRGDTVMRFTVELWKNRVLPVWRQIMGRDGGWHEGGEYVGIGIGQAIYQLPAMWRSATGEDLFATEPGIRAFLDFLVYRRRPDSTDFRWGDGSNFERKVPDAIALALELHHAAAYTLASPSGGPAPSSWPWGPLTDAALNDPAAVMRMPLVRLFDGIGMLVARSDWSPAATYVTFKAGDNYWSHSHLDQGAFTIYKGGALAIDSGLYGPEYGSDHHMNYAYQTIAHNVVTVSDPADTVPAPGKDKPRPIANDGGQRRIGSGWSVEAAPLDRVEWEAKRETYHTGEMGELLDQGGLAVVAADITSAYTNARSGEGTFSARTRRVERFWRIFGYDRVDDVVVIFDQVTSSRTGFRKRWLLHTLTKPTVFPDGFTVDVPAAPIGPGHAGGRLEARVLLPKSAVINPIGGQGFEFFVDDKNYDENGTLGEIIRKLPVNGPEPGAWRVEVSPPRDEKDDLFLVVLLPSTEKALPAHRVTLLERGDSVGCEVAGPNRTTRWWFEPGRNAAAIDITAGSDVHHYVVAGPERPVASLGLLESILGRLRFKR